MRSATLVSTLVAVTMASAPANAVAQDLTCDRDSITRASYDLSVAAAARNVTLPRSQYTPPSDVAGHLDDLADLNASAVDIAEEARRLDDRNLMAHAQLARQYLIDGIDARLTDREWRRVLDSGGAVAWTATLYDVDARSYFIVAFDRESVRIYRMGQLASPLVTRFGGVFEFPGPDQEVFWRAVAGCLPDDVVPEATIPWSHITTVDAKNWVLEFHLANRVAITSDRGKRKSVDRLKMNLHGAAGHVDVLYNWDPYRGATNVRGIGMGPAPYQDRVRRTIVKFADADHVVLPQQKRGAGW